MKKIILTLLIALSICSCKKEQKKLEVEEQKVEQLTESEIAHNKVIDFLEKNENIDSTSFNNFYKLFQKDYHLTKEKSKYNAVVNLVKKTLKEKDLEIKNKQYTDLKNVILKLK